MERHHRGRLTMRSRIHHGETRGLIPCLACWPRLPALPGVAIRVRVLPTLPACLWKFGWHLPGSELPRCHRSAQVRISGRVGRNSQHAEYFTASKACGSTYRATTHTHEGRTAHMFAQVVVSHSRSSEPQPTIRTGPNTLKTSRGMYCQSGGIGPPWLASCPPLVFQSSSAIF